MKSRGKLGLGGRAIIVAAAATTFAGQRLFPQSPIWDWLGILWLLGAAALIIGFVVLAVRHPSDPRRLTAFVDKKNALRNEPVTASLDPTARPSRQEAQAAQTLPVP